MLARGRGPVLTSHLFTKAFAYLEGETSSFQKGTIRAADVLHLGLGAASARSRASSKATATADWDGGISSKVLSAPFLPPDHPLVERPQVPHLEQLCFSSLSLPISSAFTEGTFHL